MNILFVKMGELFTHFDKKYFHLRKFGFFCLFLILIINGKILFIFVSEHDVTEGSRL